MAKRTNDSDNEKSAPQPGSALSYLITEQDIHAFVDGELPDERRAAVARFLGERAMTAREAAAYLRSTFDLRAIKNEIYADAGLKAEIDRLMAKRADLAELRQVGEPALRVSG